MTLHAGYAASRISSKLKGSTKQFGWLQAPDFAALRTLMSREEKQQTAAGAGCRNARVCANGPSGFQTGFFVAVKDLVRSCER
jgi:hypothetical protein